MLDFDKLELQLDHVLVDVDLIYEDKGVARRQVNAVETNAPMWGRLIAVGEGRRMQRDHRRVPTLLDAGFEIGDQVLVHEVFSQHKCWVKDKAAARILNDYDVLLGVGSDAEDRIKLPFNRVLIRPRTDQQRSATILTPGITANSSPKETLLVGEVVQVGPVFHECVEPSSDRLTSRQTAWGQGIPAQVAPGDIVLYKRQFAWYVQVSGRAYHVSNYESIEASVGGWL